METIGRIEYKFLKSKSDLTPEELARINQFENRVGIAPTPESIAYAEKVRNYQKPVEQVVSLDSDILFKNFQDYWKTMFGYPVEMTEEMTANVKALCYYFAKDDRFFKSCNPMSSPSFEKGLMLVGAYGNGKTDSMRVFQRMLQIPGYSFKSFSSHEVVNMYLRCEEVREGKTDFIKTMCSGRAHFDDLKAEQKVYGQYIFTQILETREKNNLLTHVAMNYKDGSPGDLVKAVDEIEERYGGRVYDRVFKMFNIVEWHGKSMRK